MRGVHSFLSAAILCTAAASMTAWGCLFHFEDDCELDGTCPRASGTSSGTGPPAVCVPSKNVGAVGDACGAFASDSLGDDAAGDGTKANPFKTLTTALMRSNGKPVYACSETFAEAVVISAGTTLYGGLDCTNGWIYGGDTARTTIAPGAEQVPLTLSSGSGAITVENVAARSADAMTPGASSVAVKAEDGSTAELTRCDVVAGDGAEGDPGMAGDPNGMPALSGQAGKDGGMACSADTVVGGGQTINDCGGVMSIGGGGGNGQVANGVDGQNGTPDLGLGQGGMGEPAMGAWSCGSVGQGSTGENGTPGMPGGGASGTGTLTAAGYQGTSGAAGTPGTPGQGGGGGGGAKGGAACSGPTKGGASGGSGGSGGCGGLPGAGGGSGGSSIGLISFNAKLTLTDCTVTAGNGGPGGKGGDAQPGGLGGSGGVGGMPVGILSPGCKGGDGGRGGNGGPGGGGLGGASIAVAHVGDAPEQRGAVMLTKGMPGAGGLGGDNGTLMNNGAPGLSAEVQAF